MRRIPSLLFAVSLTAPLAAQGPPQPSGFIVENPVLNGETIRLDGALRMPPR